MNHRATFDTVQRRFFKPQCSVGYYTLRNILRRVRTDFGQEFTAQFIAELRDSNKLWCTNGDAERMARIV